MGWSHITLLRPVDIACLMLSLKHVISRASNPHSSRMVTEVEWFVYSRDKSANFDCFSFCCLECLHQYSGYHTKLLHKPLFSAVGIMIFSFARYFSNDCTAHISSPGLSYIKLLHDLLVCSLLSHLLPERHIFCQMHPKRIRLKLPKIFSTTPTKE